MQSQPLPTPIPSCSQHAAFFSGFPGSPVFLNFLYSFKQCELLPAVAWPGAGPEVPRSAQLCSHPWTLTSGTGSWCIAVYTGAASFLCKLWCPRAMSKKPSDTPISALTCPFLWPARLLPANTYPHRLPANPAAPRACQSPPPCLLPLHRLLLPLPPHLAPGVSF